MKNIFKIKNTVVLSAIVYFVFYYFIGAFIILMFPDQYSNYARLSVTLITFILLAYISKEYFLNHFFEDTTEVLDKSIKLGIIAFVLVIINLICSYMTEELFETQLVNNTMILLAMQKNPFIIGIITIILLPFSEELIFKYQFLNKVKLIKKKWIKIVMAALVFSFMHCLTEIILLNYKIVFTLMYYLLFYIITAHIYMKNDNLMMSVTLHMLVNACAFILSI